MNILTAATAFLRARYHGFITFLLLLGIWAAVSGRQLVSADFLPSPAAIAASFLELSRSGLLGESLLMSLIRIIQGFLIGSTLGFLLGAFMGVSRTMERLFAPLVNALRQVPVIGWIPLIIVWCGIADLSKITFIGIGAFFPMVLNTFAGVRSVPHGYLELARVLGFGRLKLLSKIVIPAALPSIASGLRLSLGTSWMLVVWSEINTRSDLGIGDMLDSAREGGKMDVVIVCILVIGAVAFLINALLGQLESHLQGLKKADR